MTTKNKNGIEDILEDTVQAGSAHMHSGGSGDVVTKLLQSMQRVVDLPAFYTSLWSINGATMAIARGEAKLAVVGFLAGLGADATRYFFVSGQKKHWKNLSPLEQILAPAIIKALAEELKSMTGSKGTVKIDQDFSRQYGSGVLHGGYITRLSASTSDGMRLGVLYKYTEKKPTVFGEARTNQLRNLGFGFVPGVVNITDVWSPLDWGSSPPKGTFYFMVNGSRDLREIHGKGENNREFVEDFKDVLRKMKKIYLEPRLTSIQDSLASTNLGLIQDTYLRKMDSHDFFFYKVVKLTGQSKEDAFSGFFVKAHGKEFSQANFPVIHGDFHDENILQDAHGENHIIDWDNSQRGIPYQDFMFFSVMSGFEKSVSFVDEREDFLDWQKRNFPAITDQQNVLTEFKVYQRLFKSFKNTLEGKEVEEKHESKLLNACKYLHTKSIESLDGYCNLIGDDELLVLYRLATNEYNSINACEIDGEVSVPEAHKIIQSGRLKGLEEIAQGNVSNHEVQGVKGAVKFYKQMGSQIPVVSGALIYGLGEVAVLDYNLFMDWAPEAALALGVALVAVNYDKIVNQAIRCKMKAIEYMDSR